MASGAPTLHGEVHGTWRGSWRGVIVLVERAGEEISRGGLVVGGDVGGLDIEVRDGDIDVLSEGVGGDDDGGETSTRR